METLSTRPGETVDVLFGGLIRVIQKKRGYRFSLDSLLLAHFLRLRKNDRAVEFGTGSAVIALILGRRFACEKIIGLEFQEELADIARRNVLLNGMEDKIEVVRGDVRDARMLFPPESGDVVFFNPPYRKSKSGRVNPDRERALARHEIAGSVGDFVGAAAYVLKAKGSVYAIYPASRLVELITRLRLGGLEPKRLRLVHSKKDSRAEFALVEATKGGREELAVLPPLCVYDDDGEYTEEMEGVFSELSSVRPSSGG
ncbi:MAG: methyltransferase [Syntrophobacterales bacterium]|nr:methyltransferase [Syntrophobacterales bacterium]